MSKKDLFEIVLKVIALILFIQFLNHLPELYVFYTYIDTAPFDKSFQGTARVGLVLSAIILIVSSIILWFFSGFISNVSFKEPNNLVITSTVSKNDLYSISFTSIGLYLFLSSIPSCISSLIQYSNAQISFGSRPLVEVVNSFLLLLLGLFAFFGSKGLVFLLNKIQSIGIKQKAF